MILTKQKGEYRKVLSLFIFNLHFPTNFRIMGTVEGGIMYSAQTENEILRQNVYELQKQLNEAHIRIKELTRNQPLTEEELIRKVMIARGLDPTVSADIKEFWRDYHGIENE